MSKKEIWEKDLSEPRGFIINGTGAGAIDVYRTKRSAVLVSVFSTPTGKVWPSVSQFKNMNQLWAECRRCGLVGYSKRVTAEIKDSGKSTLDCGATVTRSESGYSVEWPAEQSLLAPNSPQNVGANFFAGACEVMPNIASAHAILHLWGSEISLDAMYRQMRERGSFEIEGKISIKFVGIWKAGRTQTVGKTNRYQRKVKQMAAMADQMAALTAK
jgi:hypothetical protein